MNAIGDPCDQCKTGEITLHFYPRVGPAPGNMRVCTNPECEASLESHRRRMEAQMHNLDLHFKRFNEE